MNIKSTISRSITRSIQSIDKYPMVIIGAFLFMMITIIRIQVEIEEEQVRFLYDCMQMSLAAGISFSLFSTAYLKKKVQAVKYGHIMTVIVLILAFVLLYFFSRGDVKDYYRLRVTDIAGARLFVWILICQIGFIVFLKKRSFGEALFIFMKSMVIAFVYGAVLMSGTTGVAGAVQGLLYNDMSEKVYMHLSAIVSFMTFTIFIGNFPDLDGSVQDYTASANKPKAVEILLTYIVIPIILSLSMVLLLWIGKAIFLGEWPSFNIVMGIVTSYIFFGVWLYLLVADDSSGLTVNYRKIYPVISLLILIFGLWSFVRHLSNDGFRNQEYFFSLLLLIGITIMLLILIKKESSQDWIPILLVVVMMFSIGPKVGYHQLPVGIEIDRLEGILREEGMFENQIISEKSSISDEMKIQITQSVQYISNARDAKLPSWFDRDFDDNSRFKEVFGFEKTWSNRDFKYNDYVYLHLTGDSHDISDYDYAVYMEGQEALLKTDQHDYKFVWYHDSKSLELYQDDELILEETMDEYFEGLRDELEGTSEVMSHKINRDNLEIMLVFKYVNISLGEEVDIYSEIKVIYFKE